MGPLHAYALASRLEQVAEHRFTLNQGTLYPALVRLEHKGWIRGTWQRTENNREARYYSLTRAARWRCSASPSAGGGSPDWWRSCCWRAGHEPAPARLSATAQHDMAGSRGGAVEPRGRGAPGAAGRRPRATWLSARAGARRGAAEVWQRRVGAGPAARCAVVRLDRGLPARPPVRAAAAAAFPGLHRGRRVDAGCRDRRQHDRVHRDQRGAGQGVFRWSRATIAWCTSRRAADAASRIRISSSGRRRRARSPAWRWCTG